MPLAVAVPANLLVATGAASVAAELSLSASTAASSGTGAAPGTSASSGTSGSAGTSAGAGTSAASGTTASAGTTAGAGVNVTTSKSAWAIQMGETIYVNERLSTGPSAWVAYKAIYVFGDGNACLVREPDCVTYTGPLLVAYNLRRVGESYASDA